MERLDRELTVALALGIIDAAHWQARDGPVPRTNALRLALGYLFERSGGRDRKPYDDFWRICGDPMKDAHSQAAGNNLRTTWLNPSVHGIWRTLGLPPDAELSERIRRAQALERRELTGSSEPAPVVP